MTTPDKDAFGRTIEISDTQEPVEVFTPSAFIEELCDRLGNAPVFEALRKACAELEYKAIRNEDVMKVWKESQNMLEAAVTRMEQEGVLGKEVLAAGKDLRVPKIDADPVRAVVLSSLRDEVEINEQTLEESYSLHEVRGVLSGVTLDFVRLDEDCVAPTLSYQVRVGQARYPHQAVDLFATGAIETTSLNFVEDIDKDLMGYDFLQLAGEYPNLMNKINTLYRAVIHGDFKNASWLRHIGHHLTAFVAAIDSEERERVASMLSDLVERKLTLGSRIEIATPELYVVEEGKPGTFYSKGVTVSGKFDGVVFVEVTEDEQGIMQDFSAKPEAYGVLRQQERMAYFPLSRIDNATWPH